MSKPTYGAQILQAQNSEILDYLIDSNVPPLDTFFFFFLSALLAGISSGISICQGGFWSLTQPPAPSGSISRTRTEQLWLYLATP